VLEDALRQWLERKNQSEGSRTRSDALIGALEKNTSVLAREMLAAKEHFVKKSMWMYGGDGWAYDIGYGGLDHVLSTGEDVNILVVDTEVYSNTGGQASKATPIGAVVQFATSGKRNAKKDLGQLAMGYGNIYVAQVAMGANQAQLIRALKEAESYQGPSLIIAYAPCINHGIVRGMAYAQMESKLAVESGYWHLYRYDPRRKEQGLNPFMLDSKEPTMPLREFLMGEVRYAALTRTFPDQAETLFAMAKANAAEKYQHYLKIMRE
jgi:pyruvate-ferredoxin/flavodoxin oxidoreductase